MYVWNSYIEAPRWAGVATAIRNGVHVWPSLTLDNLEEDKGLIRTTIRFSISGPEEQLRAFQAALMDSIREYDS